MLFHSVQVLTYQRDKQRRSVSGIAGGKISIVPHGQSKREQYR